MAPSSAPCRSTRRRSAWCASPPRTCGSRARSRRSSSARSKPSRSPSRPPASRASCCPPSGSWSPCGGPRRRSTRSRATACAWWRISSARRDRGATRVSPSRRRPESPRARDPIPSPCDARPAVAEVVLGIETSCDETSAAVLVGERRRPELASLVILSQDVHQVFGGVVPELASRAHLAALPAVAERALAEAGVSWSAVDAVAVTQGPGLVGALLVGVVYAKALAYAGGRDLIGVHHMEGHLFAPAVEDPELTPPFVALLVSGGHTLLLDVPAWGRYRLLGQTRDDAAGEAFDKVATLLGLGYPGGPPLEDGFEFSFSGLKTAVLRAVRASTDLERDRPQLARAFQDAVLDVLVTKLERAVRLTGRHTAVLGGGVSCSRALATLAGQRLAGLARVAVASPRLNADNAAMIARAGWWRLEQGERSDWTLDARADLPLPGLEPAPATPHSALAMTIYPLVLHLGPFNLTGYGIMMMVAFLMAGWTIQLDLRQRGLDEEYAADIILAAVLGGLVGAKLWYVLLTGEWDALFRRGGFVWYGGFLGGVAAVLLNGRR